MMLETCTLRRQCLGAALLSAVLVVRTWCQSTSCEQRSRETAAAMAALHDAGVRCKLTFHAEELPLGCSISYRLSEPVPKGEEFCFVPGPVLLQPFMGEGQGLRAATQRLSDELWDIYSEQEVCESKAALAVMLIQERREGCRLDPDSGSILKTEAGEQCSLMSWLLPEVFTSAITFSHTLRRLLNGTSGRAAMMSLEMQADQVHTCIAKVKFFSETSQATQEEILWGFHAVRTRASGSDKYRPQLNPVTTLFNYHPNKSLAHVFSADERLWEGESGDIHVVRGDIMRARHDLAKGDEVYYRYGEYSNAELVVLYGFVVPPSVARETGMTALRTIAMLSEIAPLPDFVPRSEFGQLWRRFGCMRYQTLALDHNGELLLELSRWFPACARVHFFLSGKGPVPEALSGTDKRLHVWPGDEESPIEGESVAPWPEAAAHASRLLCDICKVELARLDAAANEAGLDGNDGPAAAGRAGNEAAAWAAVEQVVRAEHDVLKLCVRSQDGASDKSLAAGFTADATRVSPEL